MGTSKPLCIADIGLDFSLTGLQKCGCCIGAQSGPGIVSLPLPSRLPRRNTEAVHSAAPLVNCWPSE